MDKVQRSGSLLLGCPPNGRLAEGYFRSLRLSVLLHRLSVTTWSMGSQSDRKSEHSERVGQYSNYSSLASPWFTANRNISNIKTELKRLGNNNVTFGPAPNHNPRKPFLARVAVEKAFVRIFFGSISNLSGTPTPPDAGAFRHPRSDHVP